MFASTAVALRPGIAIPQPRVASAPADVTTSAFSVVPRAPWARGHRSFRGTRIFTALMLGWAGLVLVGFGLFAVPAAHDRGAADAGLLGLLGTAAPWLWSLGIVHLVAAVGIVRDRAWAFRASLWLLAAGAFVVATAAVLTVAGRDPIALVDPATSAPGFLAWTLGLYALVGWGLRRVMAARGLARG